MKSILISIKPEWVAKILNGEKTIEVRRTAPKCDFPITVYIYCTKNKLHHRVGALVFNRDDCFKRSVDGTYKYGDSVELMGYSPDYPCDKNNFLNGKVVAKFTLRKVDTIYSLYPDHPYLGYMTNEDAKELLKRSCLSDAELTCYIGFSNGYAWHISDLEIFNEPKELADFGLKRAPQSWFYVEEKA